MLQALENSLGVVTVACKQTNTPRSTYYKWLKEDEEFSKAVKEIENIALDFAESQLHNQMKDGCTAATIFYLKTKGKKRGYVEKQEVEQTNRVINILEVPTMEAEEPSIDEIITEDTEH